MSYTLTPTQSDALINLMDAIGGVPDEGDFVRLTSLVTKIAAFDAWDKARKFAAERWAAYEEAAIREDAAIDAAFEADLAEALAQSGYGPTAFDEDEDENPFIRCGIHHVDLNADGSCPAFANENENARLEAEFDAELELLGYEGSDSDLLPEVMRPGIDSMIDRLPVIDAGDLYTNPLYARG